VKAATPVQIIVCDAERLRPALDWLYRDLPPVDRGRQVELTARDLEPQNVFVAARNDQVLGVLVAQSSPGRVGWLGCPILDGSESSHSTAQLASLLIEVAVSRLSQIGLRLIQTLIPPTSGLEKPFETSGFVYITEVIRMNRACNVAVGPQFDPPALEFLSYGPSTRDVFPRIMERTYEGSLDIPELDGLRPVKEVIEGYQASGRFRPEEWLLARRQGEFVGCVLLSHWPDENYCELQYMGVVPEARGRSVGRALCCRALDEARAIGAIELCLSVDARNRPAIGLYKSVGFDEIDRRKLFILRARG
jgi:ribosomal protein S18 acetylase RimI-like enzyme